MNARTRGDGNRLNSTSQTIPKRGRSLALLTIILVLMSAANSTALTVATPEEWVSPNETLARLQTLAETDSPLAPVAGVYRDHLTRATAAGASATVSVNDGTSTPVTGTVESLLLADNVLDMLARADAQRDADLPATRADVQRAMGGVLAAFDTFSTSPGGFPEVALVEAAVHLRAVVARAPQEVLISFENVDQPPVLAIDFRGEDSVYTEDYVLLIDFGGNDTYLNNAGGARVRVGTACATQAEDLVAAALIDLSGHDSYVSGRDCGVNGGGIHGARGALIDFAGNDMYSAGSWGTNGGGSTGGRGFLLDVSGEDAYSAGSYGTNGAADTGGRGFLLDLEGNDLYSGPINANGGGLSGSGFVLDISGHDVYEGTFAGVNGGATYAGSGFLADLSGNDRYTAMGPASIYDEETAGNGGATVGGVGFLYDGEGVDAYYARGCGGNGEGYSFCSWLSSSGVIATGVGLLHDAAGVGDHYVSEHPYLRDVDAYDYTEVPRGLAGAMIDAQG